MNPTWSEAFVKIGHRLAMHPRVDRFQLRNTAPEVSFTFDDAQTNNGSLIFCGHDATDRSIPSGSSPALLDQALKAAARGIPALAMAEAMQCAHA
jgi:hypothetical protein